MRVEKIEKKHANERGYTLIAMMALMTIMGIFMLAAAPKIQQQQQRNLEEEAISRGEEVAQAIGIYARFNNGKLPNSMDELLEGVNIPGRTTKLQILRASAARDPLSSSGEWKLVRPNTQAILDFATSATEYNNNVMPQTSDAILARIYLPFIVNARKTDEDEKESAPGGEDTSESATGPFIGVTSRSQRNSVITYYGIERHDKWVFTPLLR